MKGTDCREKMVLRKKNSRKKKKLESGLLIFFLGLAALIMVLGTCPYPDGYSIRDRAGQED